MAENLTPSQRIEKLQIAEKKFIQLLNQMADIIETIPIDLENTAEIQSNQEDLKIKTNGFLKDLEEAQFILREQFQHISESGAMNQSLTFVSNTNGQIQDTANMCHALVQLEGMLKLPSNDE